MPPAARPIFSLDLGTADLGLLVALPFLPLRVLEAQTLSIRGIGLAAAAEWLRDGLDANVVAGLPPDLIVELGSLYIPEGSTPQKARAMAANHARMEALFALICVACPGPVYQVVTIARRTWSSRVVPHHQGGITNAEANAGLAAHLDPAGLWPLLSDQHRRDAAGALIGYLIGSPSRSRAGRSRGRKRIRAPRPLTPKQAREAAQDAAFDALLEQQAERVAEACEAEPIAYSGMGRNGRHSKARIQPCTYPTEHPGSDDPDCGAPATSAGPDGPLCGRHANLTRAEPEADQDVD